MYWSEELAHQLPPRNAQGRGPGTEKGNRGLGREIGMRTSQHGSRREGW